MKTMNIYKKTRVMKYLYNVCYFMDISSDTYDISALDG